MYRQYFWRYFLQIALFVGNGACCVAMLTPFGLLSNDIEEAVNQAIEQTKKIFGNEKPWEILKINQGASEATIEKAFNKERSDLDMIKNLLQLQRNEEQKLKDALEKQKNDILQAAKKALDSGYRNESEKLLAQVKRLEERIHQLNHHLAEKRALLSEDIKTNKFTQDLNRLGFAKDMMMLLRTSNKRGLNHYEMLEKSLFVSDSLDKAASRNAALDDLKKKYIFKRAAFELAMEYATPKEQADLAFQIAALQQAYATITDDEKRAQYNKMLVEPERNVRSPYERAKRQTNSLMNKWKSLFKK